MIAATFNSTTGWVGKTINYDDGVFTLEGHGVISAAAALSYYRQGSISWAYDGLLEWVEQVVVASAESAPGATHGWAVGENGTILATTDGGHTWIAQRSGTDSLLNSVYFTDARHGYAAGDQVVMATSDGGATWRVPLSGFDTYVTHPSFIDGTRGWAKAGEPGHVLVTRDGGASWDAQTTGVPFVLADVAFADARHGWGVGVDWGERRSFVLRTTDGGTTWGIAAVFDAEDFVVFGTSFPDATTGWAVGCGCFDEDGVGFGLIATKDGGATWSQVVRGSGMTAFLMGVVFVDVSHGWVVGMNGVILVTRDGGETWSAQDSGTEEHLEYITFLGADGRSA